MLVQDPAQPELWTNPEWSDSEPGTFAVVIGVSRYEHLDGSEASYGLGQLGVSALTAYNMFSWLRDSYSHPDKPLARCWLLLAPSAAEVAAEPALATIPWPTFDRCSSVIGYWFQGMKALNSVYAEKSRALFFFSGHGLEVAADRQILLPSDYLKPPNQAVNRALSTYNLYAGLRALPVPEHFFFIDACRNDHQALRELSLDGTAVLNVWPSYKARSDIKAPIVYATGPGAAAWQPTDPKDGPSIFGQALVEGLSADAGMVPVFDGQHAWVTFRGLEDFLDPRVEALLLASGTRIKQPVRIWGPVGKLEICEVPHHPPAAPEAPAPPPGFTSDAFEVGAPILDDFLPAAAAAEAGAPGEAPTFESPAGAPAAAERASFALEDVVLPAAWPRSAEDTWSVVRNEFLTAMLASARTCDMGTGAWHPFTTGALAVRRVARDARKRVYRIDVEAQSDSAIWLELNDPLLGVRAACVLPSDRHGRPIYTLELDLDEREGQGRITDFDVVLSHENSGLLGQAARLWTRYRALDIGETATPGEMTLLEAALAEKRESPLAATVAALLLLRAWRHELMRDWPRNLAEWFPQRPDGCVIWAECLLRAAAEEPPRAAIPWILRLEERGLPHTAEGLSMAARQAEELLRFALPAQRRQSAAQLDQHARLERLHARLKHALRVFRPGGLAATFIGRRDLVVPELLSAGDNTPTTANRSVSG